MFLSTFIELGRYRFYIMSERTLCYRTDNVWAKRSKSQKWEGEAQSTENACVCWLASKMKLSIMLYNVTIL
jgi:hypothetical protein